MSSYLIDQLIAGVIAGGLSTTLLHPLDLLKTQWQVSKGPSINASSTAILPFRKTLGHLAGIARREGWRGLYRGYTANLAGSTSSWGLYFLWYQAIKDAMGSRRQTRDLSAFEYFFSASLAGTLTVLVTNPLWLAKTRLCTQEQEILISNSQSPFVYRGLRDALEKIYRTEGISGLYRGLLPGLLAVSHGGVQFLVYEEMKRAWRERVADSNPSALAFLGMSSVSKIVASLVTYPLQVVRSRSQQLKQHQVNVEIPSAYRNLRHVVIQTWRGEGWRGFYRGLVPNTLRVLPGSCITFLVYEEVSGFLKNTIRK